MTATLDDLVTEPLLSPAEVDVLAQAIEAGVLARAARLSHDPALSGSATMVELLLLEELGEQARHRFVRANLRLVAMVARQFAVRGSLADSDLFQEGCLGLMAAVERFDHRRGFRFSTYALYWIRAHVGVAAARQPGVAQLPTSRAEQLRAVRGLEAELAQTLGRPADVVELATALGRSPEWTARLLAHRPPQSLDALDGAFVDRLAGPAATESATDPMAWVRDLLHVLPDPEREVIELRLGFADGTPRSFAYVAETLQMSATRARRVELRALERLRAHCPQQASAQL